MRPAFTRGGAAGAGGAATPSQSQRSMPSQNSGRVGCLTPFDDSQRMTQTQELFSPEEEMTQAFVDASTQDASSAFEAEQPWAQLVFANDKPAVLLMPKAMNEKGQINLYVLGRGRSADVQFQNAIVSSAHCMIYCEAMDICGRRITEVYIEDCSANGTFVNGVTKIRRGERRLLNNGDEVYLVKPRVPGQSGARRDVVEATSFTFINFMQRQASAPPAAAEEGARHTAGGAKHNLQSSATLSEVEAQYDIRQQIGRGTAGVVHVAVQRRSGRRFAIKVIDTRRIRLHQSPGDLQELTEEANLLQQLRHPNIIRVEDVFVDSSAVYVVMELVEGGDLFDRIVARGVYDESIAKDLMLRIMDAVKYLHERDIVHRDLKPENILLVHAGDDVACKLTDFGLAKKSGDGLKTFCGTPAYFAPEVLKRRSTVAGEGRYGKAADMWSLGVILYVLLAGRQPFDDTSLFDQIETAHYRLDGPGWKIISKEAKDLLHRLLERDPTRRITAAQALQHKWFDGASPVAPANAMEAPRKAASAPPAAAGEAEGAAGAARTGREGQSSGEEGTAKADEGAEGEGAADAAAAAAAEAAPRRESRRSVSPATTNSPDSEVDLLHGGLFDARDAVGRPTAKDAKRKKRPREKEAAEGEEEDISDFSSDDEDGAMLCKGWAAKAPLAVHDPNVVSKRRKSGQMMLAPLTKEEKAELERARQRESEEGKGDGGVDPADAPGAEEAPEEPAALEAEAPGAAAAAAAADAKGKQRQRTLLEMFRKH